MITNSDKHLLIKLGVVGLVGVVLWRVSKPVRDTLSAAKAGLDSVSAVAGETLSDITARANGWTGVKLATARFYLDEKYVASDGTINRPWKNAMMKAHSDIEALFDEILDPKGRLKIRYQYLVNNEVSSKTIYGSDAT